MPLVRRQIMKGRAMRILTAGIVLATELSPDLRRADEAGSGVEACRQTNCEVGRLHFGLRSDPRYIVFGGIDHHRVEDRLDLRGDRNPTLPHARHERGFRASQPGALLTEVP